MGTARFGWRDIVRVWSSAPGAQRMRRPTDVLLLIASVLLLAALALVAPGPTSVDSAISSLLAALPSVVDLLWGLAYTTLAIWAVVLVLLPLAFSGRRRLTLDLLLAAAIAVGGAVVAGAASGTDPADSLAAVIGVPDSPVYVAARLGMCTAVIVAASPHVSRPLRYWGRIVVTLGAIATIAFNAAAAIGAVAGILVGIGAAALTHLLLGSPQGLLTAEQVDIGLADLGIDADSVTPAEDLESGEVLWRARTSDDVDLRVKVYGRDAWDSQVVGSLWASLTRRGEMPTLGRGRESRVEHEALVTIMAERAGVRVAAVVTAGRSGQGDALIATVAPRSSFRALAAEDVTDALLDSAWESLIALHGARMSHGRIDGRHVVLLEDGAAALADFADGQLNANQSDQLVDRARLLVNSALKVGDERALASAMRMLGDEGVVDLLPFLQPAALGRATRQDLREVEWTLKDLRSAAVTALGVPAPALQQIRRVTLKSVAIVAIIAIMAYTLMSAFSGVDFQSVVDALASANFWILLGALIVSPFIQAGFAFSTIGATLKKLTYFPVLMLQYGIQFIALCLPSTAARLALEVRFFERFGVPAASAIGMGMIDSFAGFIVQISLIVLILVSGLPAFTSSVLGSSDSSDSSGSSGPGLIAIVIGLSVLAAIVTLAVPRLRRRLFGRIPHIREQISEQRRNAGDSLLVLHHPRKILTMASGNLLAQVLQAVVLGICLAAFGQSAALSQLILINTAVSLFAGLMPVPGGMGVAEAGYTAGLQAIGIPAPIAVGAAIAFRLVTFYLPPLWGSVAMRWLRRHEFI
jgi:uncharacterized membrane protein YbhN (UPF0104 family)